MRATANRGAANRVDRHDCAHSRPIARHRRGRAEAALQVDCGRAVTRTRRAELDIRTGIRRRGVAEIAIGRESAPVLVAAVQQVEHDRARHDRHADIADRKAAALLAQPSLRAGHRVEPEGGAAREHDGIDALDRFLRLQQIDVARARRAATDIGGGHRGFVEQNRSDAGGERDVVGIADLQAGDIGDEVAHVTSDHIMKGSGRRSLQEPASSAH